MDNHQTGLRARWNALLPYLSALLVFICSRFVMLLGIAYADRLYPARTGPEYWNLDPAWCRYLLRYDTGWYLKISTKGYTYDGNNLIEHPVVFFPLFPLLNRFAASVFGVEHHISMFFLTNLLILVAVLLAFKLIREEYGDKTALYAVALLSFFPTSLFFSAGYAESLTFLLIVSFFLLLKRKYWIPAALCAGLASATRPTGVVLALPLVWELWQQFSNDRKRFATYALVCVVLATSGLWLYASYLWIAFGNPLAFATAHEAWLRTGDFRDYSYVARLLLPFRFLGSFIYATDLDPVALDPWFFFTFLALIIIFRKQISVSYLLFALGFLILPYLSYGGTLRMRSFARYSMLAFPVFIIMANILKQRWWLLLSVVACFAVLLFIYTALFAQWRWAG